MKNIINELYFVPNDDGIAVLHLHGLYFKNDLIYDDWKLYYYRDYNDSNYNANNKQNE